MSEGDRNELPRSLYSIQNDVDHYHTGFLSSGNQVLMDEATRIEFDTEGNMLAVFTEEAPQSSSMMLPFTPGTISVKSFFLPELWLGIRDLPDHYQDFLDHPENSNEDERFYYPEEIKEWREGGNFVLWWNEDYFLNEEGELESS